MVATAGVTFASMLSEKEINSPLYRCNDRGRNDHNGKMIILSTLDLSSLHELFRKHIMGLDVSRCYTLRRFPLSLFRTSSQRLWALPPVSISASLRHQTLLGA
jgi:hypothetical protein